MRISKNQVQAKIAIVNGMLGNSNDPNAVGRIELSGAYGGYGVHRISNEYRGVSDLMGGHHPLREVARFVDGMIAVLRIEQEV